MIIFNTNVEANAKNTRFSFFEIALLFGN